MNKKILANTIIAVSLGMTSSLVSAVTLEEITVTAQKREQSAQDIPFSVSALTGETLEETGVFDIIDLQNTTPSLMIPSTGAPGQGASIRLRGFGSPPFQLGIEPAVATFVDGVYRSRSGVAINDLVDIDRIEVLKGPQGTLFGKNTTAGVIHIITKRPDSQEFDAFVEASYEKYSRKRIKGMVNVPLVEGKSALRVSGMWGDGDGWLNNDIEDHRSLDRSNLHAQLLLTPSDDLDVNLSVSWGEIDEVCCGTVTPDNAEDLQNLNDTVGFSKIDDLMYSAEVNWNINDGLKLTSVTSYQDYETTSLEDADFIPFPFADIAEEVTIEAWTQELRLAGSVEGLEWVVGAFYSDEEIKRTRSFIFLDAIAGPPVFGTPGLAYRDDLFQEGESYSVFAHSTWSMTDALSLSAGFRYNQEEKSGGGDEFAPNLNILRPAYPSYRDEVDENETTGTLSIQYEWSEDVMTYFTYTTGYKAGGINLSREAAGFPALPPFGPFPAQPEVPATGPFEPEKVKSYELGAKTELLDNRLRLNIAYFMSEYDDQQNSVLNGTEFFVVNGEGADIKGFEIEGLFAATDSLTLNFGATFLRTEFEDGTSFDNGVTFVGGVDLPWAPELAASAGWNYTTAVGDGGLELFWTGSYVYKDEFYANAGSVAGTLQDSSTVLNTRLGIQNGNWSVALWCRNCTDERVAEVSFPNPLFGNEEQFVNRPIEVGITGRYNF